MCILFPLYNTLLHKIFDSICYCFEFIRRSFYNWCFIKFSSMLVQQSIATLLNTLIFSTMQLAYITKTCHTLELAISCLSVDSYSSDITSVHLHRFTNISSFCWHISLFFYFTLLDRSSVFFLNNFFLFHHNYQVGCEQFLFLIL